MAAWRYEISLLVLKKYFQQKTTTKKKQIDVDPDPSPDPSF